MEVYIEFVIIDNFFVNLLLIYVTAAILKLKVKRFRYMLAALIGAGCAVLLPFVLRSGGTAGEMLYKLAVGLAMPLVFGGFYKKNAKKPSKTYIKQYLLTTVVFVFMSFALGGAVTALGLFFPPLSTNTGLLGLTALGAVVTLYAVRQIYIKLRSGTKSGGDEAVVTIPAENGSITARALLDNGNKLTDSLTLKPVIIISSEIAEKLDLCPERHIEVSTVSGKASLPLVKIAEMHIKNDDKNAESRKKADMQNEKCQITLNNVLATISPNLCGNYDLIFNNALTAKN